MITVAFDVGSLFDVLTDKPNQQVINLFHSLDAIGCDLFVWSIAGEPHTKEILRMLGLKAQVCRKPSFVPDIAIDDDPANTSLGKVVIFVSKLKNLKLIR